MAEMLRLPSRMLRAEEMLRVELMTCDATVHHWHVLSATQVLQHFGVDQQAVGLLMGGTSLLTRAWAYHSGMAHWQTMVFTVLSLSQMGHVLAIRSETQSLFRQGLWSNAPLLGAVVLSIVLQLLTIYLPPARAIFKTEALSASELGLCLVLSAVVFVAVEIEKALMRNGRLYQHRTIKNH